jgi:membrane fusion protein (multidrug efflux system)
MTNPLFPSTSLAKLLVILLLLTMSACTQEPPKKPKKKKQEHLVETATATRADLSVSLTRTGTLKARREVNVFSQEEGAITELPYYEGDTVQQGDLIARLDDKLIQAQLNRTRATRRKAEQDVKRLRDMYQKKLASDADLAEAETALEVARADEQILSTRLSYTRIEAPLSGIVTKRLSEPGNVAERHTHLLTITDPTSLITEVSVSGLLLAQLKTGDITRVSIDALGYKSYQGRIMRIHPSLNPTTRRGTIEVELRPVPVGALPGQLCRVQFNTHTGERLTIPFRAIRRDLKGKYVFLVDNESRVQRVTIQDGLRIGEYIEVLDGLSEGQQVVTKGFLSLISGKKVKWVQAAPDIATNKSRLAPQGQTPAN